MGAGSGSSSAAANQPAAAAAAATAALAPGDAVGVSLVRGDLALGATGTVTHVDGNRVYAFGHPFFNLGPTEFPMTKAYVHALLPSLFTSAKLASIGDIVGTVQQDRATAIAGTLGRGPDLVPVKLTLAPERGAARTFNFAVAKDQMFTPLLTFASIVNTLQAYEREFGAATFSVRGQATVKGHGPVALEDIFTGDTASIGAAAYVAGPLNILLRNDLAPVQISGVDLTIVSHEEPRTTTIERAWLDNENPRAGTTVPLHILTRTYRGEETHAHRAGGDSRERERHAVGGRLGRHAPAAGRAARPSAVAGAERRSDDPHLQSRAPQQPHLRAAGVLGARRGHQWRDAVGAAAVGARGD